MFEAQVEEGSGLYRWPDRPLVSGNTGFPAGWASDDAQQHLQRLASKTSDPTISQTRSVRLAAGGLLAQRPLMQGAHYERCIRAAEQHRHGGSARRWTLKGKRSILRIVGIRHENPA
jgi:hypothetical protein